MPQTPRHVVEPALAGAPASPEAFRIGRFMETVA